MKKVKVNKIFAAVVLAFLIECLAVALGVFLEFTNTFDIAQGEAIKSYVLQFLEYIPMGGVLGGTTNFLVSSERYLETTYLTLVDEFAKAIFLGGCMHFVDLLSEASPLKGREKLGANLYKLIGILFGTLVLILTANIDEVVGVSINIVLAVVIVIAIILLVRLALNGIKSFVKNLMVYPLIAIFANGVIAVLYCCYFTYVSSIILNIRALENFGIGEIFMLFILPAGTTGCAYVISEFTADLTKSK